ncbi:MAG: alpha/beta hydrolase [Acidimicrobiales bacterium]
MLGCLSLRGRTAPFRRSSALVGVLAISSMALASCATPPPTGAYADRAYRAERIDDLNYGAAIDEYGDLEQLDLTMFRPVGADGPRPAIVFIHSGAFTGGYRSEQDSMAEEYAERGYVTVTITYRLHEGAWIWFNTPSDIALQAARDARHDAQASVRWLRANAAEYGIDPGHIGAVGYSAGAITAIGVGEHPEDPGDSGTPGESSRICVAVSISGIAVEGNVQPDDAEVLMFHGGADVIVPTAYARQSAWEAGKAHRLAGYVEFPKIGHTVPQQRRAELTPTMTRVLKEYLVDKPPCA